MTTVAWKALNTHLGDIQNHQLRDLFASQTDRFQQFHVKFEGGLLDYSKNRLNQVTLDKLFVLASEKKLEHWRERLFSGDHINHTEQRAVLHTALRDNKPNPKQALVTHELKRMQQMVERFSQKKWLGSSDKPLREVVVIGIGGSYLGPKLACEALQTYAQKDVRVHYISNVDAHEMHEVLDLIEPTETLFIVISKSFTTQETSTNMHSCMRWLLEKTGDHSAIQKQFVGITANTELALKAGITADNILSMWDWVGGRYSLWSTVGLPLALLLGMDHFRQLLAGAYAMDEHFKNRDFNKNVPVLMALIGIWNRNFLNLPAYAVLPYDNRLRSLPRYLQQLDMESNGKGIDRQGQACTHQTAPILFGEAGTNGQHAFHQLLHQGTTTVPCDFIGFRQTTYSQEHHHILLSNMLAQSQAMMTGRTLEESTAMLRAQNAERIDMLAPAMSFSGNRPSNTLLFDRLTPFSLGSLLALYEHKVFVQGVIWNINSFDQMGVELGKTLSNKILHSLQIESISDEFDGSTAALLTYLMKRSD